MQQSGNASWTITCSIAGLQLQQWTANSGTNQQWQLLLKN